MEFGAKVATSLVGGYAWIEAMEWDPFNEALTLQDSVEAYKQRFGVYPAVILADKIYRNREILRFCKGLGIRLSGPALGRPTVEGQKTDRKQERLDAAERNAIEGKFGEGKRRFGLGLIRAKGATYDGNRPPVHGDELGASITSSFCTFFQNRHAQASIRELVWKKYRSASPNYEGDKVL